jgi:REP element-mobilizing transposase RayT
MKEASTVECSYHRHRFFSNIFCRFSKILLHLFDAYIFSYLSIWPFPIDDDDVHLLIMLNVKRNKHTGIMNFIIYLPGTTFSAFIYELLRRSQLSSSPSNKFSCSNNTDLLLV